MLGSWEPGILRSWDPGIVGCRDPTIPGSSGTDILGSRGPGILPLIWTRNNIPLRDPGDSPSPSESQKAPSFLVEVSGRIAWAVRHCWKILPSITSTIHLLCIYYTFTMHSLPTVQLHLLHIAFTLIMQSPYMHYTSTVHLLYIYYTIAMHSLQAATATVVWICIPQT